MLILKLENVYILERLLCKEDGGCGTRGRNIQTTNKSIFNVNETTIIIYNHNNNKETLTTYRE